MSFLYYTNYQQHNPDLSDISYAFECGPAPCKVRDGPDGQGVIYADNKVQRVGYYPDEQTWKKIPQTSWWVGMSSKPIPSDLARKDQIAGDEVEGWHIPIARSFIAQDGEIRWLNKLPSYSDLDDEGNWIPGNVLEKYGPFKIEDIATVPYENAQALIAKNAATKVYWED